MAGEVLSLLLLLLLLILLSLLLLSLLLLLLLFAFQLCLTSAASNPNRDALWRGPPRQLRAPNGSSQNGRRLNGLGSAIGEGAHGDVSSVDTTVVNEAGPSDAALLLTT